MRKQLYLNIVESLKRIVLNTDNTVTILPEGATMSNGQITLFRHFDLWNQQVAFLEEETPFETPAVFVEFRPLAWQTLGFRNQSAQATVRIHIVTPWFSQTADYSPDKLASLEYLNLPNYLSALLEGKFLPNHTGAWTRNLSEINHNHTRYVDSVEQFTFELYDNGAQPIGTPVEVTPVIYRDAIPVTP
jgi:hypothetical protein